MSALTNEVRRITIRVPATLHKALAHAAIDRDTSLNRLAVEALEQYLATLKGKEGWFPLSLFFALVAILSVSRSAFEGWSR
ncbi:MAG TPA: toxin-antitoxin system HicB family antitoxin, partial [Anaerolineae bacterium]|nr:toxin-antitoxin system HicB family antitoxin [Anaerolineae bacterium]